MNPRAIWWHNLKEVTINGDYEVTFHLKRPQPSFLSLFASGWSPVYPCHVSPRDMRTNPIGTGPFKFVEFKRGESIKFVRNPDYWKKGRPYRRRHRVAGHREPLDAHSRLRRRRVRSDVLGRRVDPAAEGRYRARRRKAVCEVAPDIRHPAT